MKKYIENARHIVIMTHMAPDGDAMGSSLAMWHWIRERFAVRIETASAVRPADGLLDVTVIVPNAFPAFLSWMPGANKIMIYENNPHQCDAIIAEADLFICTDFNDPKRIGPMGDKMLANPSPKILLDHHLGLDNGQWTMDNGQGLTEVHSEPEVSSSCEIVYKLLYGNQSPITDHQSPISNEVATCIYTGLMTDTGNFSFNSTSCKLYEIIADLMRAGVKKDEIYNAVFNQYSTDRMRLTGYALYRKMRIYPEHHLSLITLSADELDRFHYQQGDCEGLVNMPLQIADVFYSVTMREERPKPGTPKSRIRLSFRSQGDRPVNIWANEVFHGGGHANASGGEFFGTIDQAVALFEKTYKKYLKI